MNNPFDPVDLHEDEAEIRGHTTRATGLFALFGLLVGGLILGTHYFLTTELSLLQVIEGATSALSLALAFFVFAQQANKHTLELIRHHVANQQLPVAALDASNTAVWAWNLATGDLMWNTNCVQLLGYDSSLKKPNYRSWYNRVFPADRPYVEQQIKLASEGQKPVTFEYRRLLADGGTRWTQTTVRAIRDDDNKAVALTGIMRDFQARKQLELDRIALEEKRKKSLAMALFAIANEVEQREPYRSSHLLRMSLLAVAIGRKLGMSLEAQEGLRMGAYLHDIGKIMIPASILNRKGPLNLEEQSLLRSHPQRAFALFKDIDFPWPLQTMILQHRERLDGSGYPNHYVGEQITTEARILAVADVVVSMAAPRPYRPALGLKAALEEIYQRRNIMYDEKVVMACIELFTKDGFTLPAAVAKEPQPQT